MLRTGQVGYVVSGMKSVKQARIGDTIYTPSQWSATNQIEPLEGYAPAKQMLFSSIFPVDTSQIDFLYSSVERLCLNDNSVSVKHDQSASLGSGLRCGFLGFLHMEVFMQRLQNEFNMSVVVTSPSVPYLVQHNESGETKEIQNIEEFPTFDVLKDYTVRIPSPSLPLSLCVPSSFSLLIHLPLCVSHHPIPARSSTLPLSVFRSLSPLSQLFL
jgi:translation factor GUF1, mitochondrial